MHIRFLLLLLIILLIQSCRKNCCLTEVEQPNIVFIMADDMGYNDIDRHLALSPNATISKFINEATEVENFNVQSNCSPSRHAFISGVYSFKKGRNSYGMRPNWVGYGLSSKKTIAEEMKENGYKTGLFGKWHLAETYTPNTFTFPYNRGFDYFFGLIGGSINYYTHMAGGSYFDIYRNEECLKDLSRTTVTELIADETIEFMKENRKQPFFAYVSFTAPHKPYSNNPGNNGDYVGCDAQDVNRFWVMEDLMTNTERIMKKIEDLGLSNNTYIIFTSDNGAIKSECNSSEFNMPLRGHKGSLYDGALRVRFYVKGPWGVSGRKVPVTTASHIVDLYPTFTAIAQGSMDVETDGINMFPVWKGQQLDDRIVINDLVPNNRYAAKMAGYKLVSNADGRITDTEPRPENWELFDLVNDPGETNNLFGMGLPVEQILMDSLFSIEEHYTVPIVDIDKQWEHQGECFINN